VLVDVLTGCSAGIPAGARQPSDKVALELMWPACVDGRKSSIKDLNEIAVDFDPASTVAVAEPNLGKSNYAIKCPTILKGDGTERFAFGRYGASVPQCEGHRRMAQGSNDSLKQPTI
jgi:hypothetical protein